MRIGMVTRQEEWVQSTLAKCNMSAQVQAYTELEQHV
jgi:hypothetical protein